MEVVGPCRRSSCWRPRKSDLRGSVLITALQDRDLLAGAPTGSGKTMAYLIPLLHHLRGPKPGPVRALIVAPTRELATQIHDQLRKISGPRGVRACVLTKANEGNLKQGEGKKGIFGERLLKG